VLSTHKNFLEIVPSKMQNLKQQRLMYKLKELLASLKPSLRKLNKDHFVDIH